MVAILVVLHCDADTVEKSLELSACEKSEELGNCRIFVDETDPWPRQFMKLCCPAGDGAGGIRSSSSTITTALFLLIKELLPALFNVLLFPQGDLVFLSGVTDVFSFCVREDFLSLLFCSNIFVKSFSSMIFCAFFNEDVVLSFLLVAVSALFFSFGAK